MLIILNKELLFNKIKGLNIRCLKSIIALVGVFIIIPLNSQDIGIFKRLEDSVKSNVRKSNHDKALEFLAKIDSISQGSQNDSLQMRVLDNYAFYYFWNGHYENSVAYLSKATDIAENNQYWYTYLDMKNNLGMIHSKLENFEKSRDAYLTVLKLTSEKKYPKNEDYIATLINLGSALQSLNLFKKADSIFSIGLMQARKLKDDKLIGSTLKFKAKNFLQKKEYGKVISIVDTIQSNYFTAISPRMRDDPIYHRARAYFYLNNLKSAERDIVFAIELMKDHNNDPSIVDRIQLHALIKEKQGKLKEALDLQRQANNLKDSLDIAKMNSKVLEIEEKYNVAQKQKENLELQQQASQKDLTIARKNNVILLGSIGFLIVIGGLIAYQLRRLKKKNIQLERSIVRREEMAEELATVRDNISKDFHDDLGNRLARIGTLSKRMADTMGKRNRQEITAALTNIYNDADVLYKGTRDFMFSLRSKSDRLEEVFIYLCDFGEEHFAAFEIDFFTNKSFDSSVYLPYYWNRQLILIFKEAMTNVAKHSNAKNVRLEAICAGVELSISLIDDGIGFNLETNDIKGYGMNNMSDRSKRLGGILQVESSDSGTKIEFRALLKSKY